CRKISNAETLFVETAQGLDCATCAGFRVIMGRSTAEVSLRLGPSLTVLLCGLLLAGSVAAQTKTQMAQCNGSDPALVIAGCTAVIVSSQSPHDLVSL